MEEQWEEIILLVISRSCEGGYFQVQGARILENANSLQYQEACANLQTEEEPKLA